MDPLLLNILIVAGVVALFFFMRRGQLKPELARQMVKDGARLVDVRSPGEFSSGHLPGAINVPVGELGAKVKSLGAREGTLILYCASGARSAMAKGVLKNLGFTQVHNLGAMSRW